MLAVHIQESPGELGGLRAEWDELAVRSERPFAAPAWPLAWWDHLRPSGATMSLVIVRDGDGLAGVVPLYRRKRDYAPLGGGIAPVEPVARPGQEGAVAASARTALAQASPRPATLEIETHGSSPRWTELLAEPWDGREGGVWRWTRLKAPVPGVDLGEEGFDQWFAGRSSTFRREMRSKRRKLDKAGGSLRFATAESLERDVCTFLRLHRQRLAGRGGTSLTADGLERMLVAVGAELLERGRFRLICIDLEGETIAAHVMLAAGRELSAWNGGFDEAHAKLSPSMQCVVEALRDASERGERTMSLGSGAQDYKYRMSNREDSLSYDVLVPRGPAFPLTRLRLVPRQLRAHAGRRLPTGAKLRLRGLVRRR